MPGKLSPKPKKLLSKSVLRFTWENARNKGKRFTSKGVDGKSGEEFSAALDDNLASIAKSLASGDYKFRDLRCKWIDKKGNSKKERLICIPTVSDRIVQRAIAKILETNDRLGVKNSVSFGFQEGLGVQHAVNRALQLRNSGSNWAVKTDVISFFDRIERSQLKMRIQRHLPSSLVPLIEQIIDCEVRASSNSDKQKLKENGIQSGRGLRQGMPLSPLLSNFELREFDGLAIRNLLKMVRYADDIVVFCTSEQDANKVYANLVQWLATLNHSIPTLEEKKKTFIVSPEEGVEFLGLDLKFSKVTSQYEPVLAESTIERILSKTRKFSSMAACEEEKWDFGGFVKGMKSRNASLMSTYSMASNREQFRNRLQIATNESTRALLKDIFGEDALGRISDYKLRFLGVTA